MRLIEAHILNSWIVLSSATFIIRSFSTSNFRSPSEMESNVPFGLTLGDYEVLVRLVNPRGEIVYPGAFLPTAERFGLMQQIDAWVLTHAVKKLSELNQLGVGATFTINISGHSLMSTT